jgi:diguanylate cyclase (GGDEF)-like protein
MSWPFGQRRNERGEVELLRALLRLAHQLQSNLDLDAVVRVIATAASETFGFGEAAVLVREPGGILRAHAAVGGGGVLDLTSNNAPLPVDAIERLFTDRHRIGEGYFLAGNDPEWEAVGLQCLAARGPATKGAWKQGDTLLIPLRDRKRQLSGLLRLGSPLDSRKPTLEIVGLLGIFATHAVVAIDNAWEHRELQRVTEQLEEELNLQHDLADVSRKLLAKLDQQSVFDEIARVLGQLVPYDTIGIALVDEQSGGLEPVFANPPDLETAIQNGFSRDHPLIAPVLEEHRAVLVDEKYVADEMPPVAGEGQRPGTVIVAPLTTDDEVFGVLLVGRWAGRRFDEREFELAVLFANLAAIAVQNARTYREMERLASSDGLTGMHNYRHFRETLAKEVSRADRYGDTFCLLMMDLDHFKAVNDTIGHQQGDEVLKAVAAVLRQCSRESDYLARYGGEEFVMILPRTPLREARTVAERVRRRVREIDAGSPALRVSVSIGVAAYPQSSADMDGVLRAADAALLRAKAGGRNQVQFFDEEAGAIGPVDDDGLQLVRGFCSSLGLTEVETSGAVSALIAARLSGIGAPSRLDPGPRPYRPLRGVGSSWSGHGPNREAFDALLYRTEKWDGSGYPEGLSGEKIPRVARVYAVCRSYLEAGAEDSPHTQEALWKAAGIALDPRLVQRFLMYLREQDGDRKAVAGA